MNGGVLFAVESCKRKELVAAMKGYEYLGAAAVVSLIEKAVLVLRVESLADELSRDLDDEYHQIASDAQLDSMFYKRYAEAPGDFAPVH